MLVYSLWLVYLRNHPESLGRYTDLYLITYIATDMKIERNSFKLGLCLDSIILCFPGLPLYSSNYPVDKDTHVCAKSLQSRPTLCDSLNRSPPGSCVHGILQARILGWVAMSSSRGIFPTQWSTLYLLRFLHCRWVLYRWATGDAPYLRR